MLQTLISTVLLSKVLDPMPEFQRMTKALTLSLHAHNQVHHIYQHRLRRTPFSEVPAPRCAAPMRKLRRSAIAVATTNEDDQIYSDVGYAPILAVGSCVYYGSIQDRYRFIPSRCRPGLNAPVGGKVDSQQRRRSERQSQVPIPARLLCVRTKD